MLTFMIIFLPACSAWRNLHTVELLPEDARELHYMKEKKEEIWKAGLEEGRRLCRQEFLDNLAAEIQKLQGMVAYEELYREGYLVPSLVLPVLAKGGVSPDGKTMTTGRIEWHIIEDAHFTNDDMVSMLLKKKGFVSLGIFDSYTEAKSFGKKIEESLRPADQIKYLKVKGIDDIAVIIETTPYRAKIYADRYKGVILNE